ncbi:ABC-F family ATP-binding cassette domain-containing protein [Candidatus Uabimicrobium sp. HlEnr_7]|uniref:ABC-F family ATP-binding cassette domain-containing protein n=1 Tax=Candidatus Uabimicrobium helgolandensis TaxID=3095367 RepID=UPI003556CCE8
MSTLIQVMNVEKLYGNQEIFKEASTVINSDQKIGVIGRNGAGKSTLFKIIIGEEDVDDGKVKIHPDTRIGYLEQHDPYTPEDKVLDFLESYTQRESWECGKVAAQFQLYDKELELQIGSLSGGYQMRVKLTAMLLKEPNILMLDEPTNFLDLSTLLLLEKFLRGYRGALMVISHDREFLERTCNSTLDVEHCQLSLHSLPLGKYLDFKQQQLEMYIKQNEQTEKKRQQLQQFVDRFGAKNTKASQARSKEKQISRLQFVDVKQALKTVHIHIPEVSSRKGPAIELKDLAIGYPEKMVANDISFTINHGEKIAIVGDNGQGKTTLLKTLVGELEPKEGSFRYFAHMDIGYYAQHVLRNLNEALSIYEYLDSVTVETTPREKILQMAGSFLFRNDDLKKKISVLSGGEKARLCMAGLLLQKHNCLFLDEPSNHLDFETVEALAIALKKFEGTVLFVSHNRAFARLVATEIVEVKQGSVLRYYGNYDSYLEDLERKLDEKPPEDDYEEVKEEKKPVPKKQIDFHAKRNLKKELSKLEKQIEKSEKEKKELDDWFHKNAVIYDEQKTQRYQDVIEELEKLEEKWLEIQEQLS